MTSPIRTEQSHTWLATDDLSDCIANVAAYLALGGYVVQGQPVVAATDATVGLTVEGHSATQTADLFSVLQHAAGTQVFAVGTVANAVNGVEFTGSATGQPISFIAQGTDADISFDLAPKGAGTLVLATANTQKVSFYGGAGAVQQAITGALSTVADPPALAVLTSIIAALVGVGLVTDGTT